MLLKFAESRGRAGDDLRQSDMARRSEDWNVGLAHDLQDPKFAREFLLGAAEGAFLFKRRLEKSAPWA